MKPLSPLADEGRKRQQSQQQNGSIFRNKFPHPGHVNQSHHFHKLFHPEPIWPYPNRRSDRIMELRGQRWLQHPYLFTTPSSTSEASVHFIAAIFDRSAMGVVQSPIAILSVLFSCVTGVYGTSSLLRKSGAASLSHNTAILWEYWTRLSHQ